jgi:hypothetical protein
MQKESGREPTNQETAAKERAHYAVKLLPPLLLHAFNGIVAAKSGFPRGRRAGSAPPLRIRPR